MGRWVHAVGWRSLTMMLIGNVKADDQEGAKVIRENLLRHVEYLTVRIGERNLWKDDSLERAAEYIGATLGQYGYAVQRQSYTCYGRSTSNIVVETGGPGRRIIVGAHYDAVPNSPGSDDNGSGVDGVLEIARILKDIDTDLTFVFVLFDAEEFGVTRPTEPSLANGFLTTQELGDQNIFAIYTSYHGEPGEPAYIHTIEDSVASITYVHNEGDPWRGSEKTVYMKPREEKRSSNLG